MLSSLYAMEAKNKQPVNNNAQKPFLFSNGIASFFKDSSAQMNGIAHKPSANGICPGNGNVIQNGVPPLTKPYQMNGICHENGGASFEDHLSEYDNIEIDEFEIEGIRHRVAQIPRSLSLTNGYCTRREFVELGPPIANGNSYYYSSRSCMSTPDGSKTCTFGDVALDDESFVHVNEWSLEYGGNPCSKTEVIYLHSYR